ncbi:MAG: SPOR domain-containing protein [Bacteroidetes bacterium]|nr:MAG: SPOR domain-containing protein [Bacteroidota bacterium]TAG85422.1 MAG: SPOR domain-containing protein [Bacteroidota bacterium]
MKKSYYFSIIITFFALMFSNFLIAQEEFESIRPKYEPYQRTTYEGESKKIEAILNNDSTLVWQDNTDELNKTLDFIPKEAPPPEVEKKRMEGWRIMIYRGRDREEALTAKRKSYEIFPKHKVYYQYKTPSYKVKVGDFQNSNEYKAIFKRLKREFPDAVVVPDIINLIIINKKEKTKKEEE